MAEKGLYLYCVAAGNKSEDLGLKGMGGATVFSIAAQELCAVVQECKENFSSEENPKLMSEWILTHQAVVDLAVERFETVVPFSFGTLIISKDGKSCRENLLEWLAKEQPSLSGRLKKLKGKAEYGIQISWDPAIVAPRVTKSDEEIQKLKTEISSKSTGTAYLLRQKLETLLRQRLETAADIYFKECYQKIKACSEEVRVEKIRKENPPHQMLANLSCLVMKGEVSKLGEELEKIGKIEGFFVRFTGPWPPYSFVNP